MKQGKVLRFPTAAKTSSGNKVPRKRRSTWEIMATVLVGVMGFVIAALLGALFLD
jgi:hypothetical protein